MRCRTFNMRGPRVDSWRMRDGGDGLTFAGRRGLTAMNDACEEQTHRLRNSVNCIHLAVALLRRLDADPERRATLELIERQAGEAEAAAAALESAATE
jgi:hypothetical protein